MPWGMHDDAEGNMAADSQTKRENDPFLHHLIDLSAAWEATGEIGTGCPMKAGVLHRRGLG